MRWPSDATRYGHGRRRIPRLEPVLRLYSFALVADLRSLTLAFRVIRNRLATRSAFKPVEKCPMAKCVQHLDAMLSLSVRLYPYHGTAALYSKSTYR
jgi:hypothetical protein